MNQLTNEQMELSTHAKAMLKERNIREEWIWRTINTPQKRKRGADGNMHYTKAIKESGGRVLHIVVNSDVYPNRIVTAFFDRRLGKKKRGK